MSARGIELNLPDLPEVPLSLGAHEDARQRVRTPWTVRVWDAASTALPVLLMAFLAIGTWWLVRNATSPASGREVGLSPGEPDYAMTGVTLRRYGADGQLRLQVQGRELRHMPGADRLEMDDATVHVYPPDGRATVASARQVRTSGRATEVQLIGAARVRGTTAAGQTAQITGERLLVYPKEGRVRSDEPVRLQLGAHTVQAAGIDYEQKTGQVLLAGPVHAVLAPAAGAGASR